MCDESKILEAAASGALDATIRSQVEKYIENSDQTKETLYKKGCGLMKKVFEANKGKYSKDISDILKDIIPKIFEDEIFKTSLTSTLVDIMKDLDYEGYIVKADKETKTQFVGVDGGSKTLHNKTFKKPRKGNKRKKQNK